MSTETLELRLKAFRLPSFLAHYALLADQAAKGGWSHTHYLDELAAVEAVERAERRIARLLTESKLARDKTMANLHFRSGSLAMRTSPSMSLSVRAAFMAARTFALPRLPPSSPIPKAGIRGFARRTRRTRPSDRVDRGPVRCRAGHPQRSGP